LAPGYICSKFPKFGLRNKVLEAPSAETCRKNETLPQSEWLFVIGEWLFVIDSGGFGLSSPHLFKPHSPQSDPKKSQITNNKSQMTNSFRIYNQPNTGKNYSIY
jgi:hypothetical protein